MSMYLKQRETKNQKNLSLLRQVKKDMDSSPQEQAETINSCGVYSIGKIDSYNQVTWQKPNIIILLTKMSLVTI